MTFTADDLLERLAELEGGRPSSRYLVGFSGGLDSSVLLHALASVRDCHGVPLIAVHCNHALQPDADDWEAQCTAFAAALDLPLVARRLHIAADDARGIEAAARDARYGVFRTLMDDGDTVLSAHHAEDQAETLLLNLLRGSGPAGMAGVGAMQTFGKGRLCRPLLYVPRRDLLDYAREAGLAWIEDPTNADLRFDRNWLRSEILPRLARRWPGVVSRLGKSAALASEAHTLQTALADLDLSVVAPPPGPPSRLHVRRLRALAPARQRNVLRRAIALCGLPPPPATRLVEAVTTLVTASPDAQPLVRWPGAELRRYRDRLFVLPSSGVSPPAQPLTLLADGSPLALGPGLGSLRLSEGTGGGVRRDRIGAALEVRFRRGGERLRPHGRRETHRLKKLLQDEGIVPWMRGCIPLLYADGSLVAVGDLWVEYAAWSASGLAVRWDERPPLK